jgi:hypothetical protein
VSVEELRTRDFVEEEGVDELGRGLRFDLLSFFGGLFSNFSFKSSINNTLSQS